MTCVLLRSSSWRSSLLLLIFVWCQVLALAFADQREGSSGSFSSLFVDDYDNNNDLMNNANKAPLLDEEFEYHDRFLQEETTERVNILQKLRESLGLAILGCLLVVCIGPLVIWKNEGRHVRELARIDYCNNKAVVVADPASPTHETNECLVHFTGTVQVDDQGMEDFKNVDNNENDDQLHVTQRVPNALVVKRTAYIYQKFEQAAQSVDKDRLGGGETRTTTYSVKQDWTALGPQEPTLPHLPHETNSRGVWDELVKAAGTNNPNATTTQEQQEVPPQLVELLGLHDANAPPHRQDVNQTAHVGGFALTQQLVLAHPRAFLSDLLPVPTDYLPNDGVVQGLTKGSDNVLRTFAESAEPVNGDVKVVYEYVAANFEASFLVQQVTLPPLGDAEEGAGEVKFGVAAQHAVKDHCLGTFSTDLGDVWMVQKGTHDVQSMIDTAKQEEAAMNKLIRIVGWALLLVGWIMLFSPFTTALQVLPILANLGYFAVVLTALIVGTTCCCTITLLAYFRYRPLLSALLLLVAGGIWALVVWRLDEAVDEGGSVD